MCGHARKVIKKVETFCYLGDVLWIEDGIQMAVTTRVIAGRRDLSKCKSAMQGHVSKVERAFRIELWRRMRGN